MADIDYERGGTDPAEALAILQGQRRRQEAEFTSAEGQALDALLADIKDSGSVRQALAELTVDELLTLGTAAGTLVALAYDMAEEITAESDPADDTADITDIIDGQDLY